jgi:LPXTG-site transpeptidase (sortase) family protein
MRFYLMRMRLWLTGIFFLTLLLNTGQAQADTANGKPLLFPETGHTLAYSFRVFWQQNGGLDIFGYPITEVFVENGRPVQYFERARFEWFGELALTQGGLLGRWIAADKQDQPPFKPVPPPAAPVGNFFPETGHTLSFGFLNFWQARGGLPVYGYPISEEFQELNPADGKVYTVQYFERARFEYHPENPVAYEVQLGHLGRQYLDKNQSAPPVALAKVQDAGNAWDRVRPTNIKMPRLNLDTEVVEGGFTFNVWDVPRYTAVHYWPVAGFPRTPGNLVIAGHSGFRDTIFHHLPKAVLGDEIIVRVGDEDTRYTITEIMTLLPENSWVMSPTTTETLTLITCIPLEIYSHRLVVRAVPLR